MEQTPSELIREIDNDPNATPRERLLADMLEEAGLKIVELEDHCE